MFVSGPYTKILETYTLTEILEYNDITEEEALVVLVNEYGPINFPPIPVDNNDTPTR